MGSISSKIGKLRVFTESEMPDVLNVTGRRQTGRDEYGDPIYEDVVVLASKCRLRTQSGDEQVIAGRLQATTTLTLVYPHDVALSENQTVEVAGDRYHIVYIRRNSAALKAHNKALVASA